MINYNCIIIKEAMFSSDLSNLSYIVVLEFIDIFKNCAIVSMDGSQQKQILKIFVV
jgi:hypothetical protein